MAIKRRAKKEGKKVKVKRATYVSLSKGDLKEYAWPGGVDVFVDGEKVAWFMELSEHCDC
uniref:Uncharacterized protein n=1 Tax=viral metagenome TaxID=1070528 RepID=A0A6H1ZA23_9ZZZZ